jgi:hypothetical protein
MHLNDVSMAARQPPFAFSPELPVQEGMDLEVMLEQCMHGMRPL